MSETAAGSRLLPHLGWKQIALAIVVIALSAFVVYAALRETKKQPATRPAAVPSAAGLFTAGLGMDRTSLGALSPEEEAYAAALWPIHSEVKLAAMRMTLAGISYKIDRQEPAQLKVALQPLAATFQSAKQHARTLHAPQSLKDAHASYLEAIELYDQAAREMMKVATDRSDQHLFAAHERSELASHKLLQLSDVLWPGEYKPN